MLPFFAWTASVAYGVEAITGKLASRHVMPDPLLFNFYWALFILILTSPIALWYGISIPAHWLALLAASVFYALGGTFYILALYRLDASVIAPLFSFRTAIAVLFGALILGEVLTGFQYAMVAIIFIFGLFVGIDERFSIRSFFTPGVGLLLLCVCALVFMGIFIKISVAEIGFWNTTFWMAFLGQIWLLLTIPFFKTKHRELKRGQFGVVFLIAAIGTVGTIAANAAYALNVSIASTIISVPLSMFMAAFLAYFWPHLLEKHSPKVYAIRLVSAAIMFVAVLQLS